MAGGTIGERDTLDNNDVDLFESDFPSRKVSKESEGTKQIPIQKNSCIRVETFASSSEGEHFDLDVSSTEESG
jgi:hypothetical protein